MKVKCLLFILICIPLLGTAQEKKEKKIETWFSIRDKKTRERVETKYKPGTPMPDFTYEDIKGKKVSLKAFKGKYVYIDIWATWCGPCIKEMPHLYKLSEKMAGKKIVFISISKDQNREAWIKMIKKEKFRGKHLLIGEDEEFTEELGVNIIPRFILLDKKGCIINLYMTRPSNPETLKTLQALKGI